MALLPSFQNYTPWGSSKLLFLSVLSKPMPAHPIWLQPPGKASCKTGGPPTTMVTMEVAPAELCPQPVGLFWHCLVEIAEAAVLNFSPLAPSHGLHHGPTALPPPVGAAYSEEPHPAFLPRAAAFRGLTCVLIRTFVHGTPTPCSSCCWQHKWPVPMQQQMLGTSAWAGRTKGVGLDLSHGTWGFHWWL